MKELIVFDLQRFSLHDGPGIRTTVFLKGCPLDCAWCHNPESKRKTLQLGMIQKKCIQCRKCEKVCKQRVHTFTEEGMHVVQYAKCIQCGKCVNECVSQALKIYGKSYMYNEILDIVMKDYDFYQKSNGGITVSGGEPMLQFKGVKELLEGAKKRNLHVCLDTCGYATEEQYREIAKYVDIFLFDYKLTDDKEHVKYTGVSNKLILNNLQRLCEIGSKVQLRCPIIPGINDNENHFKAITELTERYENIIEVNIMPYHDMAKAKAEQIGETYKLKNLRTIEKAYKEEICEKLKMYGCTKLKDN